MERNIIDIHPLDMAELIISTEDAMVDVILLRGETCTDGIPVDTVEFRGQLYRQTTSVPVKTTNIR